MTGPRALRTSRPDTAWSVGCALACAVIGALFGLPGPAAAQSFDPVELNADHEEYHSPQHFALELKYGLYSPDIDATPGLTGRPFAELFNNQYGEDPGARPAGKSLFALEFDWQFWHPFGSFGLAASAGYSGRKSHSYEYLIKAEDPNRPVSCTAGLNGDCVRSSDTTTLNIFPLTLQLVYRFDVLAERWNIPLVPYVKAGLAYYVWFMQKGDGNFARGLDSGDQGDARGYGGVPGFVVHPGLALLLDVFDKRAAQTLDSELGINHTYLFAEFSYVNISGLGFKDKLVLSDATWNAGLAFEF